MPRCYISLGGNSGNVSQSFGRALDCLSESARCSVAAISRTFDTTPVGENAGSVFCNAAAEIETSLEPPALLDLLQAIETRLGRVRTVRWGPRTIDLDLLFYGSDVFATPRLIVPHRAAWYRRFVLDPLVEIAPDFVHPLKQAPLRTLRDRLLIRPLAVAISDGEASTRAELIVRLKSQFAAIDIDEWQGSFACASDPALIFWLGAGDAGTKPSGSPFERLPLLSRIDVTTAAEPAPDFIRHVLQSALG